MHTNHFSVAVGHVISQLGQLDAFYAIELLLHRRVGKRVPKEFGHLGRIKTVWFEAEDDPRASDIRRAPARGDAKIEKPKKNKHIPWKQNIHANVESFPRSLFDSRWRKFGHLTLPKVSFKLVKH